MSLMFLLQWSNGYCGDFTAIYNGKENYMLHPNRIDFTLLNTSTITESWNGSYDRDDEKVRVDFPFWEEHIYQGSQAIFSGFRVKGPDLP